MAQAAIIAQAVAQTADAVARVADTQTGLEATKGVVSISQKLQDQLEKVTKTVYTDRHQLAHDLKELNENVARLPPDIARSFVKGVGDLGVTIIQQGKRIKKEIQIDDSGVTTGKGENQEIKFTIDFNEFPVMSIAIATGVLVLLIILSFYYTSAEDKLIIMIAEGLVIIFMAFKIGKYFLVDRH
jgi:hypothetical protein